MKKALFMLAAFIALATPAFAAGGKIAYVETQSVFDKTKLGKKYQGIIKEYYDSRKKILDMDAEEIQKMQEEYRKQASVMNEKARKEKEEVIGQKISAFDKKRNEYSGEIDKKREELSSDFNQVMVSVLKDLAKKEKVSMIFNKSIDIMGKTEVPAILYADDDLDVTGKVIEEMDKREDARQAK